ncbi:MAG TPA: hypothetical protein VGM54_10125 [Chthoniobacter sp.]|jgi:hypothetical protein
MAWYPRFCSVAYAAFREIGMAGEFAAQSFESLRMGAGVDLSDTEGARNCLDRLEKKLPELRRLLAVAERHAPKWQRREKGAA